MRTNPHPLQLILTTVVATAAVVLDGDVQAQSADPLPATYADPDVPLLQLPTNFRARRTTANLAMTPGKPVEIFNATGAGCVRHLWFMFGEKDIDDFSIEITVDGAAEPQVRMPFRSFFGALLGFEDYHINSAGLVNFPNFTVTSDPMIPKKASPGWNLERSNPEDSRRHAQRRSFHSAGRSA